MVPEVSENSHCSSSQKSLPSTALSQSDVEISQVPTARENSTRTAIGGSESFSNSDLADTSAGEKSSSSSVKTAESNDMMARSPSASMRTAMTPKAPEMVLSSLRKGNLFGSSKKIGQPSHVVCRSGGTFTPTPPPISSDTAKTSDSARTTDMSNTTATTNEITSSATMSSSTTSASGSSLITSSMSAKSQGTVSNSSLLSSSTEAQAKRTQEASVNSANLTPGVSVNKDGQSAISKKLSIKAGKRNSYVPFQGAYGTTGNRRLQPPQSSQTDQSVVTKNLFRGVENKSEKVKTTILNNSSTKTTDRINSMNLPVNPKYTLQGTRPMKARATLLTHSNHSIKSTSKSNERKRLPKDKMGNSVSMNRAGRAKVQDGTSSKSSKTNSYKNYNKTISKNSKYLPIVPSHNTNAQMNQPKNINLNSLCVYDVSKVPAWKRRVQSPPPSVNNPPLLTTLDENAGLSTRALTALSESSSSVTGTLAVTEASSVATQKSNAKTVVVYGTTPDGKNKVEFTIQMRIIAGEALGGSQTPVDFVPNKIVVGGNPVWTPESDKKQ